jgi:hypothetical protein
VARLIPNSWGTLREANDCHLPGGSPKGGEFGRKGACGPTETLYRGDANDVEPSLAYADPGALFGAGIYLTSNKRIAGDYTAKGGEVLFRLRGKTAPTKKATEEYYIRELAKFIDKDGNETFYPEQLHHIYTIAGNTPKELERETRLAHARAKYDKMKPELEIRSLVANETVIRKKAKAGRVATYDIPKDWLDKTLDAENEISIDVASALVGVLPRGRTRDEIYRYATTTDDMGFRPSFRDVYRHTAEEMTWMNGSLSEPETQEAFRSAMKALGFKGIRYAGGITLGGGHKHNAYVFWDEQGLKKRRRKS